MWEGYEKALEEYLNAMIIEWVHRGYKNTMSLYQVCLVKYPTWLGDKNFHDAYKSNLLRKDPVFYGKYNWTVPSNLPYTWGK